MSRLNQMGLFCWHEYLSTWPLKLFSGRNQNFLREEGKKRQLEIVFFFFYVLSCLSVFLSQFKFVWSQNARTDSGAKGGDHRAVPTEETPAGTDCTQSPPRSLGRGRKGKGRSSEGFSLQACADTTCQEGAGAQLDEDGDLDVVRRPRAASDPDHTVPPRDKVHPMILTQEEDDVLGDKAQENSTHDVIKIGK